MLDFLKPLDGYKTYLAAAGLGLLAVVDVLNGDMTAAGEKFLAALAVLGVRHAIAKQEAK